MLINTYATLPCSKFNFNIFIPVFLWFALRKKVIREKDNERKASYTELEKGRDDEAKKKGKKSRTYVSRAHSFIRPFFSHSFYLMFTLVFHNLFICSEVRSTFRPQSLLPHFLKNQTLRHSAMYGVISQRE